MNTQTNHRQPLFFILIGTNGTGKTTWLKNNFLKANEKNFVVPANEMDAPQWEAKFLTTDELKNGFTGTRLILPEPTIVLKAIQSTKIKGGGLVLDDYRNFLTTNGAIPAIWRKLFSDRRHKMLDIAICGHDPAAINAGLFSFNPVLVLFKTTRPFARNIGDKVINFNDLVKAQNRVNKKAQSNPHYFEFFKPG
jgi:hypothetical protein